MAYQARRPSRTRRGSTSDPRYSTRRWTELSKQVRRRDGACLIVPGCLRGAQVADHIVSVTPDMPDWQFFDPANLRGGCRYHNNVRGMETTVQRELHGAIAVPPSRYSVGAARAVVRGRGASEEGRSLRGEDPHDVQLATLHTQSAVVRSDYTATPDGSSLSVDPAGAGTILERVG